MSIVELQDNKFCNISLTEMQISLQNNTVNPAVSEAMKVSGKCHSVTLSLGNQVYYEDTTLTTETS